MRSLSRKYLLGDKMVMSTTSMSKPQEPTIHVAEHEAIVKALREAHAIEISKKNFLHDLSIIRWATSIKNKNLEVSELKAKIAELEEKA